MKKAQMEIAGLLIIVVLVSIVFLFVLNFNVSEAEEQLEPQRQARDSQIRDNFGPVLLETTTGCDSKSIRDLLADCGSVRELRCPQDKDSCIYVDNVINYTLNETLIKLGFDFQMSVRKGNTPFLEFESNCDSGGDSYIPSSYPFSTDFGDMVLIITQCS